MSQAEGRRAMGQSTSPKLIVGVGASAGGLEAFKQLLAALPAETGMAFVLVQHLDPSHKSVFPQLLAPYTAMAVKEAEHGERLAADLVYVIPANAALAIQDGRIELTPTLPPGVRLLQVDHLFCSLARNFGPRSVGIILSGAGSDGSVGVRDIKAAGGLVLVQAPETCTQAGMPQSAINTGTVDLVLPISEMPAALERFERMPSKAPEVRPDNADGSAGLPHLDDELFTRLAALLEANAGFDLRAYKLGTVRRRVLRRMEISGHDSLDAYFEHLLQDPAEQRTIVQDLLISVTDFFRDPEVFETLRAMVVEPLVKGAQQGEALRVWVPGCATGEEAYSLAMEFLAASERLDKRVPLQIFATDVDQDALAVGRTGLYPPSTAEHVPADRLEKYFAPISGRGFQVRPVLRDAITFAAHDLTKDPPFSRMNLVSCRNVLIYLRPMMQEQVLKALHFALLPDAYLLLGSSETTGPKPELFSTLSKTWRIYRKIGTSRLLGISRSGTRAMTAASSHGATTRAAYARGAKRAPNASELARQFVMQARVPPSIVLAENGAVIFMHGELRPFLRFPEGEPRFDLGSLVTPDLARRTKVVLYKCRREKATVVAYSSHESTHGERTKITATPAFELGDGTVILTFEQVNEAPGAGVSEDSQAQEPIVEQLEKELQATREDLRNTVEELESANEELQSTNEEATSMNEELQSANEELEATTEELRSLNEELTAVNAQLREKVEQVENAHDDLSNFFSSTKIATLFLDEQLRIKRFTPAAEELLRVDRADAGRFVGDIARELMQNGLIEEARNVLAHFAPRGRELRTQDGRWLARRVLPYRTEQRRIEGVVVTWVDVTELKAATEELAVRARQQAVVARLGMRALEDPELQRFVEQAIREIQETLQTDYCKLLELQPGGEIMLLRAGLGWKEGLVGHASVPIGLDSQAGFALQTKQAVFVKDFSTERRFSGEHLLIEHGVQSGLSCVVGSGDEPYGVLGVHTRQPRDFTDEDANFLQACASVLSGAIARHEVRVGMVLERAAAVAVTEAPGLVEAARRIHLSVASEIGPVVAELWQPADNGELERAALFTTPELPEGMVTEKFGPSRMALSQGVIGRVASSRRAEWLSTLQQASTFLRVDSVRALGLSSGFALPIVTGSELSGVLAFFSRGRLHADTAFLRSLEGVGRTIGDFVRRLEIERRFQTTVEAAPSGIADRSLDGQFLRANRRFYEMTGYSREELLALSFQRITHPDDLAREEVLFRELRDGRRDKYSLEKRYFRKDGSIVWVSLNAALVTTPSGTPSYCVVIVDDISARRAAEEELRTSEERFREILVNSPAPMMVYDDRGAIVALSRSWTAATGYSVEDSPTVEAWMSKAFPLGDAEVARMVREVWGHDGLEGERELDLRTKHGVSRTFLVRARSLGSTRNGRQLRIAAALDITDRRRFENELLEASRQKDEFIAMLGHELRNPLAAIRSATEILNQTSAEDARTQRIYGILDRQTRHMARLLDGLLDVSRIIHGKITLEKRVVDFAVTVRDITNDALQRLSTGLELQLDVAAEPMLVEGDAVRLAQVVDNLVSNAIKYTPAPGRITVQVSNEGDQAVLRVSDTGEGIDAALQPNLFRPFQQGRQSLDRKHGGLGLGLALVKLLVELHGGTVEARSEGRGRGAEFVVRIPLSSKRQQLDGGAIQSSGRRKILVIEDNADAAAMLREMLELEGHEVLVASTGPDGIELARKATPDIVFCDLGLPDGVTGFDVAKALCADPATRDIFLVALTGYGKDEDRMRSEEVGFDAHLTKPVIFPVLEGMLASVRTRYRR